MYSDGRAATCEAPEEQLVALIAYAKRLLDQGMTGEALQSRLLLQFSTLPDGSKREIAKRDVDLAVRMARGEIPNRGATCESKELQSAQGSFAVKRPMAKASKALAAMGKRQDHPRRKSLVLKLGRRALITKLRMIPKKRRPIRLMKQPSTIPPMLPVNRIPARLPAELAQLRNRHPPRAKPLVPEAPVLQVLRRRRSPSRRS